MTLGQLAELVGGTVVGNPDVQITGAATLEEAGDGHISFLANPKYEKQLATTAASAVIVSRKVTEASANLLQADDPYFAFREAVVALHGYRVQPSGGVHPQASVDPSAVLGERVTVCQFATVCADATIGPGTVLYPGVFVGPGAAIGADCILHSNVTIYERCVLGDRVTLHASAVIGVDGFGYATHKGVHHKIPHTGIVRIGNDVELGAGCSVERAALGETVIGDGTKFADLVEIGHGTKVGRHCLFVSQVGLSGSVRTGDYVVIGGQVGVTGHLTIGNQVTIAAGSAIINDVPDGATVMGAPALDISTARKNYVAFTQLAALRNQVKQLEKRLAELEGNA